ncbi:MAG TPA: hypothetical protein VIS96_18870 [Terrimicrobiaceae bacterium]
MRTRTNTALDLPILAKEDLSAASAFFFGLIVWCFCYLVVRRVGRLLKVKGGTIYQSDKVENIALSADIAIVEQLLFYFAAIAGWLL